jgi:hypothetical protein
MEREKAYLKLQNQNHLLIRSGESVGSRAGYIELPNNQGVTA